jgi:hypothetical protein
MWSGLSMYKLAIMINLFPPPRDGKGFKGFLPQLDEFYFTTGKKKISENADALFRIS